jgi:hypothetical protein
MIGVIPGIDWAHVRRVTALSGDSYLAEAADFGGMEGVIMLREEAKGYGLELWVDDQGSVFAVLAGSSVSPDWQGDVNQA